MDSVKSPRSTGLSDNVLIGAAPAFTVDQAQELLHRHWSLENIVVRHLSSERDQNFKVCSDVGQFLLKIANPAEARSITRLQTDAIKHVAAQDPSVPVQRVVPTGTGDDAVVADESTVRLLTWIDGIPLHLTPHNRRQRESVAIGHAKLVLAMTNYRSDESPSVLQWDVQHAARLWDFLHAVPPDLLEPVEAALERFARYAAPKLATFERQFVHNDIQPYNLVVVKACPDRLCGILDFGDMVCAPVACDLGVACAYQVLPGEHPLQTVGEYVAAFDSVRPLSEDEFDAVPALILARQATTIVITSLRAVAHPDNAKYILRNRPRAQSGLSQLLSLSHGEAVDYLCSVCR
jgi:hydroxylysine kinase